MSDYILAQRGEQYLLIDEDDQDRLDDPEVEGRILDADQAMLGERRALLTLLALGYWEDFDGDQGVLTDLMDRVRSIALDADAFDDNYEQRDGLGVFEQADLAPGEQRALGSRLRLREVYRGTYQELMGPLVERQVATILESAEKMLRQRDLADFAAWLERYHQEELRAGLQRDSLPIVAAYTAAIDRAVLAELDLPRFSETADPFVERYAEVFAAHYADNSAGTLAVLARDANQKGLSALDAIQQRLVEWLATRANRVADGEAIRNGEAAARNAYRRGGVQRLKWRTSGRNCPYCSRLDGRTVGIQEIFVPVGSELEGAEGEPKMRIKRDTRHPPVHRRCNCAVVKA